MRQTPLLQPVQAHGPSAKQPLQQPQQQPTTTAAAAEVRYPFGVQNDFGQVILCGGAR
ncbi:hypothetical protein L9F63_018434, partial [Diploptera punctata]